MPWPKGRPRAVKDLPKGGSRKGIPNKVNTDLKAMILGALSDVGGREYLAKQALANSGSFIALVGRLLPKDVFIEANQTVTVSLEERHARSRKLLDEVFEEVVKPQPRPNHSDSERLH